jgi:hypothetical protein
VKALRDLLDQHGERARVQAEHYAGIYEARRGSMVLDVVLSRRRRYQQHVLPLIERWEADNSEHSLRWVSTHEPDRKHYGLRDGEPTTVVTLARNLTAFGDDLGLNEDEACRQWATDVAGLEHAHRLDPVVGSVSGIGPALFAYLRMRSGADALKPDVRVALSLGRLGFDVSGGQHSVLVVAEAAAVEVGISLLVLDQLLW